MKLNFKVNGEVVDLDLEPTTPLVKVLRDRLGLVGTHEGCSTGECGACTVLLNGNPVPACLVLAADANGMEVTTLEGIARSASGQAIAKAFAEVGAIQCGFCTPGFVVITSALVGSGLPEDRQAVIHAVEGQLCRCTGYKKILEGIEKVLNK
jgi:carbon-monoxide dehydrogenase small subunit